MLCHTILSNPLNQVLWHEIWRHPLLEPKKSVWWEPQIHQVSKTVWNEMTISQLTSSIESLKHKVKSNSEQLEIWTFLSKLYHWYILKSKTNLLLRDTTVSMNRKREKLVTMILENILRLETLKVEFKSIWTKYYKPDNLNMIEDKFNRLIQYFKEIKEELKNDKLTSPLLPNKWCYAKVGKNDYKEAEFEYSFEINKPVVTAKLQLLADTYAELYINGEYVDRVYARRTLSLAVDYRRIIYRDINKYLKEGENEIRVICKNFNARGAAGFNIISEIDYSDGSKDIIATSDDWKFKLPGRSDLYDAAAEDYRREVIAPNFETNRTSWIER